MLRDIARYRHIHIARNIGGERACDVGCVLILILILTLYVRPVPSYMLLGNYVCVAMTMLNVVNVVLFK